MRRNLAVVVLSLLALSWGFSSSLGAAQQTTGGDAFALLQFRSRADMKKWDPNTEPLRWAVAVSTRSITKILEQNGVRFNQPAVALAELRPEEIAIKWIKTNEQAEARIAPGTYDLLILLDRNFDQRADAYLGTIEPEARLRSVLFETGKTYVIAVDEESNATFTAR